MRSRLIPILFVCLTTCGGNVGKGNPNRQGDACPDGTDVDGDGYGEGCPSGADCNDADPDFNVDCCYGGNTFTDCPCDPSTDTSSATCFDGPGTKADVGACVSGVRFCDSETSKWSACDGSVLPALELCDGNDNDCDGDADEGVLSACGNCITGCNEGSAGDGEPFPTEEDDPNVETDGVGLNPDGDIVLDASTTETYFLWIANDAEGTVSKIDTRSLKEVARYPSVISDSHQIDAAADPRLLVPNMPGGGAWSFNGRVPPYDEDELGRNDPAFDGNNNASVADNDDDSLPNGLADNRPSRTAIDFKGNCWVANRGHDDVLNTNGKPRTQPSATKIWNSLDDCFDFDGDGTIETSTDVNGDGRISMNPADGEFLGEDDECVAVTVKLGTLSGTARAIAIDAGDFDVDAGSFDPNDPGRPWVGMWGDEKFYRIDLAGPDSAPIAEATEVVLPSGHQPYGAAIDSNGVVWSVGACCNETDPVLVGIDSNSEALVEQKDSMGNPITNDFLHELTGASEEGSYGMVIDLNGRVWVAGIYASELIRYDPTNGESVAVSITDANHTYRTRGMAIDAIGYVWAAVDYEDTDADLDSDANNQSDLRQGGLRTATAKVARVPADLQGSVLIEDLSVGGAGSVPVGVGVDFDGHVWTVNQDTSNLSRLYIDSGTGEPADDPDPAIEKVSIVDYDSLNGEDTKPYTYSDFTGLSLRLVTRPVGDYIAVLQGCPGGTAADWSAVDFDATVPLNSKIEVYVQVGNDMATLADQPYYGPWTAPPADLDSPPGPVPEGIYLRLTLRLISEDRVTSPIIHSYDVQWTCPYEGVN